MNKRRKTGVATPLWVNVVLWIASILMAVSIIMLSFASIHGIWFSK